MICMLVTALFLVELTVYVGLHFVRMAADDELESVKQEARERLTS